MASPTQTIVGKAIPNPLIAKGLLKILRELIPFDSSRILYQFSPMEWQIYEVNKSCKSFHLGLFPSVKEYYPLFASRIDLIPKQILVAHSPILWQNFLAIFLYFAKNGISYQSPLPIPIRGMVGSHQNIIIKPLTVKTFEYA